jgi:hypothetical protein
MMHILARVRSGHEFATADAINAMMHRPDQDGDLRPIGALAIVPRKVIVMPAKDGKAAYPDDRPLLPGVMLLAMDPLTWHRLKSNRKGYILMDKKGRKLHSPHKIEDILPRTWSGVQSFAERAEMEAQRQEDRFQAGLKVVRYKAGDKLRIVGDLIHGQLRDHFARFLRIDGKGRIEAMVEGMEMMGKPVKVTLQPHDVDGIAAE